MKTATTFFTTLLSLTSICILSAGCSSSNNSKPRDDFSELLPPDRDAEVLSLDTDQELLVERAKRLYASGQYNKAQQIFELIKNGYPFGPHVELAQVKIADCEYHSGDYTQAALMYEDLAKNNPGSRSLEYILYQTGKSYFMSNNGIGKDYVSLKNALDNFDQLIDKFPSSQYMKSAQRHRSLALYTLIKDELEVANFYERRGNSAAAAARLIKLEDKWGETKEFLTARRGETIEEQDTQIEQTPEPTLLSSLYDVDNEQAQLLAKLRKNVIANDSARASFGDQAKNTKAKSRTAQKTSLKLSCINGSSSKNAALIVELQKELSVETVNQIKKSIDINATGVSMRLPYLATTKRSASCFKGASAQIDEQGLLSVKNLPATALASISSSVENLSVVDLSYPPRLKITVK